MNFQVPQQLMGYKITHDMVHADTWTLWWTFKLRKNRGDFFTSRTTINFCKELFQTMQLISYFI